MKINADVEQELSRQISVLLRGLGVLRDGYEPDVHLHRGNRKKRRDAEFEANWDPDTDSIRISFALVEEDTEPMVDEASRSAVNGAEDRLTDLVRVLDRAESRPGYEFVSLKWFRDTALGQEGPLWASDLEVRHEALREAIDKRWILTSKVANPRPPHFPVTAIRLNRQAPEVIGVLGNRGGGAHSFRPIPIRGESLSSTIQRDRR